jgi:Fe-S-cluster containining protein
METRVHQNNGSALSNDLITDLAYIRHASATKEQENIAFQGFVQVELELSDRRLNATVQETTEQVWAGIDCRTCANCCKTQHPLFSRTEAQRIATFLDIPAEELRARYLIANAETGKYTTKQLPCPFLLNNLCTIYPVRPAVCVNYPHLHRNFRSRLWRAIDNASVCPIVYNVLERLKTLFQFRYWR